MRKTIILISILFLSISIFSQEFIVIKGQVLDEENKAIKDVNIFVKELDNTGTTTDNNGNFQIKLPNKKLFLTFQYLDFHNKKISVNNKTSYLKIVLESKTTELGTVDVIDKARFENIIKIKPKEFEALPSINNDISDILPAITIGTSKRSELSNQYSVRGGNFDENLIYVNDIEIYRPMLIRSGQQEGLSFINTALISSINFSAGGFEAKYGDKMSSVLDVKYKKPIERKIGASIGILGGNAFYQDAYKKKLSNKIKFSHILGVRLKKSSFILNSLDTKGEYNPTFFDVQYFASYNFNNKLSLDYLSNYSFNQYKFIPEDRKTEFGTVKDALQLNMYFEGQEIDRYSSLTNAVSVNFRHNRKLLSKFIFSSYYTKEKETFDIMSQYYMNELDKQLGDGLGDSVANLGIGSEIRYARNFLNIFINSLAYKSFYSTKKSSWYWGINYKYEVYKDNFNEWQMLDSAGYSVPYAKWVFDSNGDSSQAVGMYDYTNSKNNLFSSRISSYLQNNFHFKIRKSNARLSSGVRTNYWSLNNQFLVSPRINFAIEPKWIKKNSSSIESESLKKDSSYYDIVFKLSSGIYYQSPFYKEIKDYYGKINTNIKAQKSYHFVAGLDYKFKAWGRPFGLISEIYYKKFEDLIPFEVDNVRIRYFGDNLADGYTIGFDAKINGEFIPGTQSWLSLSLLKAEEDIHGDGHGYIPRPFDQRFNIAIFFQDHLPNNDSWRVNLNFVYGSRMKFGPPREERYKATLKTPNYWRADIGFIKDIVTKKTKSKIKKYFKRLWISGEIFNLLDANNVISHLWITTVANETGNYSKYAVPNYLTGRRFNIKLSAEF